MLPVGIYIHCGHGIGQLNMLGPALALALLWWFKDYICQLIGLIAWLGSWYASVAECLPMLR